MRRAMLAVVVVALLAQSRTALGWNTSGHMVVAALAYQRLDPAVKKRVDALLQKHPQYDEWMKEMPADFEDKGLFAFMIAATWPDRIRSVKDLMHTHNRPEWHYISIPYARDGVEAPTPESKWEKGSDPKNALQALAKADSEVADSAMEEPARAQSLCWLLHLIGDLHQPIHAVEFFSNEYPKGDRGGNMFIVRVNGAPIALHTLWDALLGTSENAFMVTQVARRIAVDEAVKGEVARLADGPADYEAWAKESHKLAVDCAYLNGLLRSAKSEKAVDASFPAPATPTGYMENARDLAKERMGVAGARIANRLNHMEELLKEGPAKP